MRLFALLAVLFTFAHGPAMAQSGQAAASVALDESFADVGGRWTGGRQVSIWLRVFEDNGVYLVCAATRGVRTNDDRRLLRAHKVMLNGRVMLRGLDWAPNHAGVAFPAGQEAACRRTGSAIVANPSFGIELQRTRF